MIVQWIKNLLVEMFIKIMKIIRAFKVATGSLKFENGQYGLFSYKGFPFTTQIHSKSRLDALEKFNGLQSDDVVILTYPKAGTHFAASVVNWIYYVKGLTKKYPDQMFCGLPLEMKMPGYNGSPGDEFSFLKKSKSPRLFGTHLPWSLMPPQVKNHEVKVIHCLRNPKDVACSAYHFYKRVGVFGESVTFDEFLRIYSSNRILYGDFFEFLRDWYPHRNNPNNLHVYFEDMVQNLDKAVRDIASFLEIDLNEEQIEKVVEMNTFRNVKKQMGNSIIHRKGVSGGWKKEFTLSQNEMFDKWIEGGMRGMDDLKFQYD